MRAYWAMLLAGFRRQATYRLAAVSGLATNAFFGVVRTAIFLALYRERARVGGLDVRDALTYVWVLEALFGVIFVTWIWETAESVRSGDFVVELLRPGDPYLRLLVFDLGRTLNLLAVRAVPALWAAALLLPLRLPGSAGGLALLAASGVLAAVVGFQLRFLFGAAAFWTSDYRAVWMLALPLIWLAIFAYWPMYGVIIAFKDYNVVSGIWGSPWVGFKHFDRFIESYQFWKLIRNTVYLHVYELVATFPDAQTARPARS